VTLWPKCLLPGRHSLAQPGWKQSGSIGIAVGEPIGIIVIQPEDDSQTAYASWSLLTGKPHGPDQGRQRRGAIPATRVVQEEARESWAPVLQHLNQATFGNQTGHRVFESRTDAHSAQRRFHNQFGIVDSERSLWVNHHRLASLLKFPTVHTGAKTERQASVILEVAGRPRERPRLEIGWRSKDRKPEIVTYTGRNHVALNVFANLYACIESFRDDSL
jgi:hypothetical protein